MSVPSVGANALAAAQMMAAAQSSAIGDAPHDGDSDDTAASPPVQAAVAAGVGNVVDKTA
jgi:hypothetical protein